MEYILADKKTLLVVDDEPLNLNVLVGLLRDTYRVSVAKDGPQAISRAKMHPQPDLILLDIRMPTMDGYEVCRRLKQMPETRDIPVIFVTTLGKSVDETQGFKLGAVDYITKPICPPVLEARVRTHLELKEARESLKNQNQILEQSVRDRTLELQLTKDAIIHSLASLAETRDPETGGHIRRTQYYVRALAEHLKTHPKYSVLLDEDYVDRLFKSVPLHDIGKVGVSDAVLLKPGKLTEQEFEEMKLHTVYGRDALLSATASLDASNSFLDCAVEIAYTHHEKWDGSGYPQGLKGEEIPLSGRLMAIADVYDALISKRCYKPAFSPEKAIRIIVEGRGTHFEPALVDAFLEITDQFQAIAEKFRDCELPELGAVPVPL